MRIDEKLFKFLDYRSTAMSITLAAARLGAILGNIIFGVFVDVACAIPILLVATLLMCMYFGLQLIFVLS